MNKVELGELVAAKMGINKSDGIKAVETVFDEIGNVLADGEKINIAGFGKFEPHERAERTYRNPQTGEEIIKGKHITAKFSSFEALKSKLN